MKMSVTLSLVCLLLFMGCRLETNKSAAPAYMSSEVMDIELQFPKGWYVNPKKNPYDLQCFSESSGLNTGIFYHKRVDLAKDLTAEDLLELQVEDLKSKRKNFQLVEAQKETTHANKRILSVVYAGDKDNSRYNYRFSCIEFNEEPKNLAMVIQVSLPSDWHKSKGILEKICASARYKKVAVNEE